MDIEEYLRQKRELEAKKEMLEAKEKVDGGDRERFRKEHRAKLYAEHGVTPKQNASEHHERAPPHSSYHAPSAGPGMWNTLLLFLILILLAVSYFIPRFGDEQIRGIVKQEAGENNNDVVVQQNQDEDEEENRTIQRNDDDDEEIPPPGPLFTIFSKDCPDDPLDLLCRTGERFDDDGKIDDEILVLSIEGGLNYYEDFIIQIDNKETEPITCEIWRDVRIDTNFDQREDLTNIDTKRRHVIQISSKTSEILKEEVIPGTVDNGNYEGKGDISTTYEARCSFCEDDECKIPDTSRGKTTDETFFRVWINKDLELTNNTTNRTR